LDFIDGEHRFPHNVGPEKLHPTKAREIHPIKLVAESGSEERSLIIVLAGRVPKPVTSALF